METLILRPPMTVDIVGSFGAGPVNLLAARSSNSNAHIFWPNGVALPEISPKPIGKRGIRRIFACIHVGS